MSTAIPNHNAKPYPVQTEDMCVSHSLSLARAHPCQRTLLARATWSARTPRRASRLASPWPIPGSLNLGPPPLDAADTGLFLSVTTRRTSPSRQAAPRSRTSARPGERHPSSAPSGRASSRLRAVWPNALATTARQARPRPATMGPRPPRPPARIWPSRPTRSARSGCARATCAATNSTSGAPSAQRVARCRCQSG